MAETVWCVFQKLPGESCPTLFAVCRSEAVAEGVVELSRREARDFDEPEAEWTVRAWSVVQSDFRGMRDIDQISHILDPMRAALAAPPEGEDEQ